LGWAQTGNLGRIRSAGAAVGYGYGYGFEGFLDVFAAARPRGFITNIAGYF
jgi:hypothetical protein